MENLIKRVQDAQQRVDRAEMADTANHRAAGKAALEIMGEFYKILSGERTHPVTGQEIASIIYAAIRAERDYTPEQTKDCIAVPTSGTFTSGDWKEK